MKYFTGEKEDSNNYSMIYSQVCLNHVRRNSEIQPKTWSHDYMSFHHPAAGITPLGSDRSSMIQKGYPKICVRK